MAKATFGAGCFWSPEAAFADVDGITGTAVGYAGGTVDNPSYEQVCTGTTGHAEVVQVEYDPEKISYEKLLALYFDMHDPTQLNRQGPDMGTQYRSVVFAHDEEQQAAAESAKQALDQAGLYGNPVVTAVESFRNFFRAEEYHQRFLEKRGLRGHR